MSKFTDIIKAIFAADKLLHASACFIIAALVGGIECRIDGINLDVYWIAPLAAMLAGVGKEFLDGIRYHGFDWRDLVADAIGAAAGTAYLLIWTL